MWNNILFAASAALLTCSFGCADPSPEVANVSTVSQGLIQACPFPDLAVPIDPAREMVIRSRGVVDDTCRTSWTASGCDPAKLGKWTFGHLMTVMSGATSETDPVARNFVANWLSSWTSNRTVGTDLVLARPNFQSKLIDPWVVASGCLAGTAPAACVNLLKNAPFRLLAIVNRIDMSGSAGYGFTSPGELRFVFGATTTTAPFPAQMFAVILEYKFPTTKTAHDWAALFHNLSSATLPMAPVAVGSPTPFADQLQDITKLIVEPGAQPGNPNNGSSIGQVRTNEDAFYSAIMPGDPTHWEFRQFELELSGTARQLVQVPVSQTPSSSIANSTSIGGTDPLSTFIRNNQANLAISSHVVPSSLLGGSSISLAPGATLWAVPNPLPAVSPTDDVALELRARVRHNFAFSTCNGCHYLETNNQNQLFHIKPRSATQVAASSVFIGLMDPLSYDPGSGLPYSYLSVDDPGGGALSDGTPVQFEYNEPWRRACEIRRISTGSTSPFSSATGHNAPPKNSCHLNNACGGGTGVCFCDPICTSLGDCCPDGPC